MDLPASRWRFVHAMNFSKPSTVGGGGEISRVTSTLPSDESNEVASLARSSRNVISDPFKIGKPLRQSGRAGEIGVDVLRGVTPSAASAAMLLLPSCRRTPDDVVTVDMA